MPAAEGISYWLPVKGNAYAHDKNVDYAHDNEDDLVVRKPEEDDDYLAEEDVAVGDDEAEEEDEVVDDDDEQYYTRAHLQPYTIDQIDQRVFIKRVDGKGRCLFARVAMKPGEIIFVESPVLAATPKTDPELWEALTKINDEEPLALPPVWHLGAITSLTKLDLYQQRIIQDKFSPDPDAPPSRDVHRILAATSIALDAKKYERALNAWRYNGFGHHAEDDGLILYNRISNMAHSCGASATWHYAENDAFVLRARRHLAPGDEITISYVNDDDLYKPTHVRRIKLSSWQFTCHCGRCDDSIDTCRGFLCPDCAAGTIFLKTDVGTNEQGQEDDYMYTSASACTVCGHEFDEAQIHQYEELEQSYIARLEETYKEQLSDAELVYQEACRVFTQHHVMYELDTLLYHGYSERDMHTAAATHMRKRIDFLSKACPKVSLNLAGLWEELGDLILKNVEESKMTGFDKMTASRCYENAFNSLIILCGADHDYTIAAHNGNLGVIFFPSLKECERELGRLMTYGIIVKKSFTQAFLRDPVVSKYVTRGKGTRTAGPLETAHIEGIICQLQTLASSHTKTTIPPEDIDQNRTIFLCGLSKVEDIANEKLNVQSYCFLSEFEQIVDPSAVSLHDALTALLPSGCVTPTSYETVGHIAHLNLLPEHLPFKNQIGALIIEKLPAIKTVVNKRHELTNEFRNCPLELIGGEPSYVTTHVEHGLRFHIDYERVFWNSRLSGERFRLTSVIPKGSDVFDVMGGVGGFGVYLAKFNGCHVVTNDLNKFAHECASKNIAMNKVSDLVRSCNMDAREFIKEMICPRFGHSCLRKRLEYDIDSECDGRLGANSVDSSLEDHSELMRDLPIESFQRTSERKKRKLDTDEPAVYFLMNLPKIAVDFLDAFVGVLDRGLTAGQPIKEPHVLVYCFDSSEGYTTSIHDRIRLVVGDDAFKLLTLTDISRVRNVSPSKNQYCVHLVLSVDFLRFKQQIVANSNV